MTIAKLSPHPWVLLLCRVPLVSGVVERAQLSRAEKTEPNVDQVRRDCRSKGRGRGVKELVAPSGGCLHGQRTMIMMMTSRESAFRAAMMKWADN